VPILCRCGVRGAAAHTVLAMSRLLFLAALLVLAGAVPASARARWRVPLPGAAVLGAFTFDRAAPYARGARRGIDLRGAPGAGVVAACGGTVTFAGRVPGWGHGVTLRCGRLVATELGLASASAPVGRGDRVLPGAVVGRLAARGVLRLGARRAGVRHGYIDPLPLLHRDAPAAPVVAPRGGPGALVRRRPAPPRPAPAPRPFAPAAPPRATALPWPAGAGLALLAASTGGGGVAVRRRRRRTHAGIALAQR
jgi:hypothetical protein